MNWDEMSFIEKYKACAEHAMEKLQKSREAKLAEAAQEFDAPIEVVRFWDTNMWNRLNKWPELSDEEYVGQLLLAYDIALQRGWKPKNKQE